MAEPLTAAHYQGPDRTERLIGWGALAMLAIVVAAVLRGHTHWPQTPRLVWLHLITISAALLLTPVLLWRRRGDRRHRQLGYAWVAMMGITAVSSLFVRMVNPGGFSIIHILSIWTLINVPVIVWRARSGRIAEHRRGIRAMTIGALLIAGFFTLPFGRMLGTWLAGG